MPNVAAKKGMHIVPTRLCNTSLKRVFFTRIPTTVLAFQHYKTFSSRLKEQPVRVDYLSRARSQKQTRQVLEDLAAGKIDILIGTHKLIGKNVKWHDLGLLIIDEEQKFGVSTKEKLRTLKTNVDTLTMSATPIPRTLQFSLMGARDMSIIRTPPPNRHPIQTEMATFEHEVIVDAINFEMSRNGQVYFVSNRIAPYSRLPHRCGARTDEIGRARKYYSWLYELRLRRATFNFYH